MKQRRAAKAAGILALAVTMMGSAQISAAREIRDVTPQELEQAALLAVNAGDMARALAFADALSTRDPNDTRVHLIRSAALRAMRRYSEARDAARKAWNTASKDEQKYSAALLMAQALSSDNKRTRAQLWLRRAAQVAPTQRHAAIAARDFKHVQRRNPWQTHLSFTLAPNNNINNGSSRDSSALLYQLLTPFSGGETPEVVLGAASKALSGLETGFDARSRYRFHQTESTAHDLRARLTYRTYALSGSAKDDLATEDAARVANGEDAQNITGSDYAYGAVQLGYGFKKLRSDRRGEFSLTADIGQSFYGGARYNTYLRTNLGQTYHANQTTKYSFGISSDLRRAQRGSDQHRLSLSTGMSRRLANGNGLYLGAGLSTMNASSAQLEYDEIRLRTGYVLGREVMGTALQFGLSTSFRDYDISPHDPSGRRDFQVTAEVTATFKQIDYLGFNPTVSFTASKTNSNIGLYDVNRTGISIGIASSF